MSRRGSNLTRIVDIEDPERKGEREAAKKSPPILGGVEARKSFGGVARVACKPKMDRHRQGTWYLDADIL
jgi:hypothetical protein